MSARFTRLLVRACLVAVACGLLPGCGEPAAQDGSLPEASPDLLPADGLTFVDGSCTGVGCACQTAADCDDGDTCTQDLCDNDRCKNPAIPNNEPCEGEPGYCGPTGCLECQVDLHCPEEDGDPCTAPTCAQGGFCTEVSGNEGSSCDDGDLCTESDRCEKGVCVGTAKDCSVPPDQCHGGGSCNATSGDCDYPVLGGTSCDDGDSCTAGDYCDAQGVCVGVAQSGWHQKVTIDYQQNDPDDHWAALQTGSYTVDGNFSDVRVSGSSDDGGYCYAYWGTGHVARYRHPGQVGYYNVNGQLYIGLSGGLCPTYPPAFDDQGNVEICQGNAGAGAFAYGTGSLGQGLAQGTVINVKARHVIGSGSDAIHCYLEALCP